MIESSRPLKLAMALLLCVTSPAHGEDGHLLWLRYPPLPEAERASYRRSAAEIVANANGPTAAAATEELERALSGMLATPLPIRRTIDRDGALVLALAGSPLIGALHLETNDLGSEGFLIRTCRINGREATVIVANREAGLLYGTFAYIRAIQQRHAINRLHLREHPALPLRILNHWDNLDRSVERGYAGKSLWNWAQLPGGDPSRYIDYARANASVGINGTVLNNVNADPKILTTSYLKKVAALADIFRPYAIRVYLSVRFSSPIETGGLATADPGDAAVQQWWRAKAEEIYRLIPDFGGFVVKANSEGQPGPQDYHMTHADGANLIARALRPHGGTVFWRAFVYGDSQKDRAAQAYDEFRPLDGKFDQNVIVQVKNGPIDFQPREPFHPLFGQMPHTRVALEAQLTREYLGQNTGVVYLGPMWTEVLHADTCSPRCGTPVATTISAMAGVANIGSDPDWTGTIFDQSNWYAFGRLAWEPRLSAREIAAEWTSLTWTDDRRATQPIITMMMRSREAVVRFMTPLGLAHQMATDYHYGPAPWVCNLKHENWNPCYYSRADAGGIGFDRVTPGTTDPASSTPPNSAADYMPPVARRFSSLATVPRKYLLWFHHVPWTYRMRSGRTVWDELVGDYDRGLEEVSSMRQSWDMVRPYVDVQRWTMVRSDLVREQKEARWWRDASIAYFQSISRLPLPAHHRAPAHPLSYYEALRPPRLPGESE